jgi:hypothetical protein
VTTLFDKAIQYCITAKDAEPLRAERMAAEKDVLMDWLDALALHGEQPHPLIAQLQQYAQKRAKHVSTLLDAHHPYLLLFVFLY